MICHCCERWTTGRFAGCDACGYVLCHDCFIEALTLGRLEDCDHPLDTWMKEVRDAPSQRQRAPEASET